MTDKMGRKVMRHVRMEDDGSDEVEDVTGGATRTMTVSTPKVSGEKIKAEAEV